MSDEYRLQTAASRALRARQLLDDELFNEAMTALEADLLKAWKATPARDTDGRERCWNAVQQLGNIKGYLESVLRDGTLAQAELKQLVDTEERKKRFGKVY